MTRPGIWKSLSLAATALLLLSGTWAHAGCSDSSDITPERISQIRERILGLSAIGPFEILTQASSPDGRLHLFVYTTTDIATSKAPPAIFLGAAEKNDNQEEIITPFRLQYEAPGPNATAP